MTNVDSNGLTVEALVEYLARKAVEGAGGSASPATPAAPAKPGLFAARQAEQRAKPLPSLPGPKPDPVGGSASSSGAAAAQKPAGLFAARQAAQKAKPLPSLPGRKLDPVAEQKAKPLPSLPGEKQLAGVEAKRQLKVEAKSNDGRSSAEASVAAKAEAHVIREREPDKIGIRAGGSASLTGQAKAVGQLGTEDGLHAEGSASAKAQAKAEAEAAASAGLTRTGGFVTGAYVQGSAEARAALEANARADGAVAFRDDVKLKGHAAASGKVEGEGHVKGDASIGLGGARAHGEAGASLTAKADAEVVVEFELADLGLDAEARVAAEAALKAQAQCDLQITPSGIKMGVDFSAMAAATATAEGQVSAKLYGRKVLSATGKVGAHAGYMYGAKGFFELSGGRLRLNLGMAASLLPAGVSAELEPAADLKPIAVLIARQLADAQWRLNAEIAALVIEHPGPAQAGLMADLKAYSDEKRSKMDRRTATSYVKVENIQKYVERRFPTYLLAKASDTSAVDAAIKEAIEETLVAKKGKRVEATVRRGQVKKIENLAFEGESTTGSSPASSGGDVIPTS